MSESQGHRMRPPGRRGLTLIESVIAVAILSLAITAVFGALTAGTAHVEAGADDLAATVAAEDLMSRLLAEDGADPSDWNGHRETAGALVDGNGIRLQGGIDRVGREVEVVPERRRLGEGPLLEGWTIRISTFDDGGRDLGTLTRWVPKRSGAS